MFVCNCLFVIHYNLYNCSLYIQSYFQCFRHHKSLTFATLGKNFKISEPIATYVVLDDVFTYTRVCIYCLESGMCISTRSGCWAGIRVA